MNLLDEALPLPSNGDAWRERIAAVFAGIKTPDEPLPWLDDEESE